MRSVGMVLIGLAAAGFVLAVVAVLRGGVLLMTVSPEGFSNACTNLALISIALAVWGHCGSKSA